MELLIFSGGISGGFDLNTSEKFAAELNLIVMKIHSWKKSYELVGRYRYEGAIFFICIIFDEYVLNTHKKPVGTTVYFRVIAFLELQTCPLI